MKHVIMRGSGYQFVCRVPRDLQQHFPSPVIYRAIKATDKKSACVLATTLEYKTQQLFLQLRSAMLPKELEKRLVAIYLKQGLDRLESFATGQPQKDPISLAFENISKHMGIPPAEARKRRADYNNRIAARLTEMIASHNTFMVEDWVNELTESVGKNRGVKFSSSEKKALGLKILNADKQLHEAESAAVSGDWSLLEKLQEKVAKELEHPYYDFKSVLDKYRAYYLEKNPDVTQGTKNDMEVECRVLLEIIGNTSINAVNTMDTVTKLKSVLKRYPLCKQQRYGDRSVHSIIKSEHGYDIISRKTANEYIKRLKAVIDYANKSKMLNSVNVTMGELFKTETAAEEQRSAYDSEDIKRLIDAICTQKLWTYGEPKPERFWIILIALFHGFRLGNIVKLTKADICQTDKGTWVFRLRTGKTKATVRPVAVCDSLLLLGFLEWVESIKREKLFQDSSDSFSKWYNRDEKRSDDGKPSLGFESRHVTTDKKKCLYSLRHSFAGNVFDVTSDYKITSDMMGHSTGGSVTARYTKRSKTETLKEIAEKMQLENIDLDRLELRATELFGCDEGKP